jgi:hypothetical protein
MLSDLEMQQRSQLKSLHLACPIKQLGRCNPTAVQHAGCWRLQQVAA